jgi:flagellar hook-basal body complex protein FliE
MHVDAIVPDASPRPPAAGGDTNGFGALLDAAGARLDAADGAEAAFTAGRGGLQEMVVARAQADVALQIAAAAAQHAVQSLNTLLGMQV